MSDDARDGDAGAVDAPPDVLERACRGEAIPRPPVWLMRQAGRYLPEYREVREEHSFREAVETPAIAEELSLQPWERFRPDGVVMYSDILTLLPPLGFEYHIEEGVGPVVEDPVAGPGDVPETVGDVRQDCGFVGDLLGRLQESVGDETTVIGFVGGPFTLASYAVGSEEERDREKTMLRRFRAEHPEAFRRLLERFADVAAQMLAYQADSGADVVQIFDTWAGYLPRRDYEEFLQPLHERLVDSVDVPVILFIRNTASKLDLLGATGADVVGLDWTVDMKMARIGLPNEIGLQGNLDPATLYGDPEHVRRETRRVIRSAGRRGHVLNLGHGVNRDTPVESVEAFVETAKRYEYGD